MDERERPPLHSCTTGGDASLSTINFP